MSIYVILRRNGWPTPDELQAAAVRSLDEADRMPGVIRWVRSYVLSEVSGRLGTACVYQAASPEAIRTHAARAGLPVDEIVAVANTVIVRRDLLPAGA